MMGHSDGSMFSRLLQRELRGGPVNERPFIQDFSCDVGSGGTIACNASTARSSPVFALQYGSSYKKFLAAADEDGYVSVINTAKELPTGLDDDVSFRRPVAQWTAHRNAIFDLSWASQDRWIYTASGDMSICLWDTSYAYKITTFKGHYGSVRSLDVSPHAPEIFATGACDGNLLIWDARVHATCSDQYRGTPAHRHSVLKLYTPHPRVYPRSGNASESVGATYSTVTAVKFLGKGSGHTVASGGLDGVVKFWDLRYSVFPTLTVHTPPTDDVNASMSKSIERTNRNSRLVHLADTPEQILGQRTYAVTSLALRPDSSQLLVSLKGGHHLMYDVDRPEIGPVKWYGGHTVSSFYVKTAFSPDGSHFASGSSDDNVCIWQVDADADGGCCAPYTLRGHQSEVTAVAWCPTDFCQLATTADDYTIKVWNLDRKQEEEKQEAPGGWVAQPRAEIILGAKPKNLAVAAAGSVEEDNTQNPHTFDTTRMMIATSDSANPLEAVTPAAGAAVNSSRLATTANPTTRPAGGTAQADRKMRISNALRLSLINKPKMKRTKQQTLAEALYTAAASQAAKEERELEDGGAKQQQRRPRSAGTSGDEEDAAAQQQQQRSQNPVTAAGGAGSAGGDGGGAGAGGCHDNISPLDENHPINI